MLSLKRTLHLVGLLTATIHLPAAPNVLIILADDLGHSDLGSFGGEIKTPNLDSLAYDGLRFSDFYNCARCWPTRSTLVTGFYPQQINRDAAPGIGGGVGGHRPDWAQLLPAYLKSAGYRAYHSGKWHIDGKPIESGFDRSYHVEDPDRIFSPKAHFEDDRKLPPMDKSSGYYRPVAVTDKLIQYLKEHQQKTPKQPFFAYVAYMEPHFPLQASAEDIARVGDRYAAGWDTIRAQRWERLKELGLGSGKLSAVEPEISPPYVREQWYQILGKDEVNRAIPWSQLTPSQQKFQQNKMTIHAAMIERMDQEIGRIIAQLKSMNAYEDTLIMFLSDNGASAEIMVRGDGHDPKASPGSAESYLCLGPGWSTTSNTPFRRHKTWTHEGGICTPFIAHWPNGIAAKGDIRRAPAHVIDIVPTILDLAQVDAASVCPQDFPGQSLKSIFAKDSTEPRPLWWYHQGNTAVRFGDWKLVKDKDSKWELFNLANDRNEVDNLAAKNPEKLKEMETQWNQMLELCKQTSGSEESSQKKKKSK